MKQAICILSGRLLLLMKSYKINFSKFWNLCLVLSTDPTPPLCHKNQRSQKVSFTICHTITICLILSLSFFGPKYLQLIRFYFNKETSGQPASRSNNQTEVHEMRVTIFAHNTGKRDSFLGFSLPQKCNINGLNMVGGQGVTTRIAEKPLPIVTIVHY